MFIVNNLNFSYPKANNKILKGLTFEIKKGEIFGFLGPSGAGKSTTQKILIKLLDDYNGTVKYKDSNLDSLDYSYYEEIGVGFEMPVHFSKLTALENLEFFSSLYKNQIDYKELLHRLGLWEERHKRINEYSKGMKVRLNFIRAILNKPEILFLDEPTNGLDPNNAMTIKKLIKEYNERGGTVFITSHIMSDIDQLCDRVAFIVDGEIKEIDSLRNLKSRYGDRTVAIEYYQNGDLIKRCFALDNIGANHEFLEIIKTNKIETIHSGESTLEDIFINITGVGLNNE